MSEYLTGTLVKCRAAFTDPDTGAAVDPTTVSAVITNPVNVVTSFTYGDGLLVKDSVGHYRVNVSAAVIGTWMYRFTSTGSYQGADESLFYIFD